MASLLEKMLTKPLSYWFHCGSLFKGLSTSQWVIADAAYTERYIEILKEEERRQEMMGIEEAKEARKKLMEDVKLVTRSITEKWLPIWAGQETDKAAMNCPLCQSYPTEGPTVCQGCPIREDTGHAQCYYTPYKDDWKKIAGVGQTADTILKKVAALAEIKYLQSLAMELSRRVEGLSQDIERAEAREREKEKLYHPYMFLITLNEKIGSTNARLDLRARMETFLKGAGVDFSFVTYHSGFKTLKFDPKTGRWG